MESGKGDGMGEGVMETWHMRVGVSASVLGRGLRACKTQSKCQPSSQMGVQ